MILLNNMVLLVKMAPLHKPVLRESLEQHKTGTDKPGNNLIKCIVYSRLFNLPWVCDLLFHYKYIWTAQLTNISVFWSCEMQLTLALAVMMLDSSSAGIIFPLRERQIECYKKAPSKVRQVLQSFPQSSRPYLSSHFTSSTLPVPIPRIAADFWME